MEERFVDVDKLRSVLEAEIGNRRVDHANLREKLKGLEAEIAALMLAQDKAERLAKASAPPVAKAG